MKRTGICGDKNDECGEAGNRSLWYGVFVNCNLTGSLRCAGSREMEYGTEEWRREEAMAEIKQDGLGEHA